MSRWNQGPSACIWIVFNFCAWHIRILSHVWSISTPAIVVHLFPHFLLHLALVDIVSLGFWRIPVLVISLGRKFLLHVLILSGLLSSRALICLNLSLTYIWTEWLLLTIHPLLSWWRINRVPWIVMLLVLCRLVTTRVLLLMLSTAKASTSRPASLLTHRNRIFCSMPFLAVIRLRVLMSRVILVVVLRLLLLLVW